jgi:hypothetical protein
MNCTYIIDSVRIKSNTIYNKCRIYVWRTCPTEITISMAQNLKGHSHEKVGEIRPWDGSLGPNLELLLVFKFYILLNKTSSHLD